VKLPRIIIAGEHKVGFVPPSILLVAAMKRLGVPIRVFYCGYNPIDVRLMQSVSEESITVINLKTCTNLKTVKTLFEASAHNNKLNVIVCDLGVRGETLKDSYIDATASDLAFALDSSIMLCCYAENQPRPAIKIIEDICAVIESHNPSTRIDGAIFVNPFDPHSFQLFENNIGRSFRWSTFGYIPSELIPPIPTIESLSSVSSYTRGTFSLRAVAGRISQMQGKIDYLALEAIGKYNQEWVPTGGVARFQKPIAPKVAIINDIALTGEGNNAELLFKSLGCNVFHINIKDISSQDFDMFYFPDGLGYLAIDSFNSEKLFAVSLKSAIRKKKIIFANGASGLIFGEKFMMPDGSEAQGLGVLPVIGNYNNLTSYDKPAPVICLSAITDGILLQGDEKINAYILPGIGLESNSKSLRCFFAATETLAGNTGYEEKNVILAGVCMDLWSNVDVIRRLFYAT